MIGKTLGHYEITGLLGKGGMGEVYRARDASLGRDVALKILPPEFAADEERVARFRREAGLVAKLNHPGVVTIYSIDEIEEHLFFTMEVVEGQRLDLLLRSTSLSLERFLTIAERIAAALAAAHEAGLIHRDLKPQNILITADDHPKILDFGLAKTSLAPGPDQAAAATEVLTDERRLVGTVPYMSPEQIESRPVDARSDLFSMGIILHEMLTGSRPFRAESDAAMLSAILRDPVPDLSGIRSDVPADLASLVRECLEKDPAHRPSNAGELKRRLRSMRQHGSGSDIQLSPEPAPSGFEWKWILGAAVVITVAAALFFGLRGGETETQAIGSLAVLPFIAGEETSYLGDGLTEQLINHISRLDQLKVMARGTVYRIDSSDPIEAGRTLGVDAVVTGRIRSRGEQLSVGVELIRVRDGSQMWGNSFQRSSAQLIGLEQELARGIASELQVKFTGEQEHTLAERPTENEEAWRRYLLGRQLWHRRDPVALKRAEIELREAVTLDPEFALAHAGLAQLYRVSWQYYAVDLDQINRLSRVHAERALELDPELGDAHLAMAIVHFEVDWDWEAAERSYLRAIELDPNNLTARQWYGEFLTCRRRFDEAYESFEAGLRIDPLSPVLHVAYAWSLTADGRMDEAHAKVDAILADDPDNWLGLLYRYVVISSGPETHPRVVDALPAVRDFARADDWTETEIARLDELFDQYGFRGLNIGFFEVEQRRSRGSPYSKWLELLSTARVGNVEKLVELTKAAVEKRHPMCVWFAAEPMVYRFKSDPRIHGLLEESGVLEGLGAE